MVKIRLSRFGKKKSIFYRIVVCDEREKNKGRFLQILGFWNPKTDEKKIDKPSLEKWLAQGAKATPAVKKLL